MKNKQNVASKNETNKNIYKINLVILILTCCMLLFTILLIVVNLSSLLGSVLSIILCILPILCSIAILVFAILKLKKFKRTKLEMLIFILNNCYLLFSIVVFIITGLPIAWEIKNICGTVFTSIADIILVALIPFASILFYKTKKTTNVKKKYTLELIKD